MGLGWVANLYKLVKARPNRGRQSQSPSISIREFDSGWRYREISETLLYTF